MCIPIIHSPTLQSLLGVQLQCLPFVRPISSALPSTEMHSRKAGRGRSRKHEAEARPRLRLLCKHRQSTSRTVLEFRAIRSDVSPTPLYDSLSISALFSSNCTAMALERSGNLVPSLKVVTGHGNPSMLLIRFSITKFVRHEVGLSLNQVKCNRRTL